MDADPSAWSLCVVSLVSALCTLILRPSAALSAPLSAATGLLALLHLGLNVRRAPRLPSPLLLPSLLWRTVALAILCVCRGVVSVQGISRALSPALRVAEQSLAASVLLAAPISMALLWALPLKSAAMLKGGFKVGTACFAIEDAQKRRAEWQVWYPAADEAQGPGALLFSSGLAQREYAENQALLVKGLAKYQGVPAFSFAHLAMQRTHAIHGAPLHPAAPAGRAVLGLHGFWGWRGIHAGVYEELASQGFTVFACDFPPDALLAVTVPATPPTSVAKVGEVRVLPNVPNPPDVGDIRVDRVKHTQGLFRRTAQATSLLDWLEAPELKVVGSTVADQSLLESLRASCIPAERPLQVVAFGQSYGGATAVQLMRRDPRVIGAMALDAWMWPVPDESYQSDPGDAPDDSWRTKPCFFVSSSGWSEAGRQALWRQQFAKGGHAAGLSPAPVNVVGTEHMDYADGLGMMLRDPIAQRMNIKGSVASRPLLHYINDGAAAMFAKVFAVNSAADGGGREAEARLAPLTRDSVKWPTKEFQARLAAALKAAHPRLDLVESADPRAPQAPTRTEMEARFCKPMPWLDPKIGLAKIL